MSEILEQYGIYFEDKLVSGKLKKIPYGPDLSVGGSLSGHLLLLNSPDLFEEMIIPNIDAILSNSSYEEQMFFDYTNVQFLHPNVIVDHHITLPMLDYRAIVEEWVKFLKEPPKL